MNPEVIAALEKVRKAHDGVLRPVDVVKAAASKKSALHRHFEWDDQKAGDQYRLEQARKMIQVCVTVVPRPDEPERTIEVRMYTSLPDMRKVEGGGYLRTDEVLADSDLRRKAVSVAISEFERWEQKYKDLQEFIEVFDSMNKVRVEMLLREEVAV